MENTLVAFTEEEKEEEEVFAYCLGNLAKYVTWGGNADGENIV